MKQLFIRYLALAIFGVCAMGLGLSCGLKDDPKTNTSTLKLNELLAKSDKSDDWIEVYNPSDKEVSLKGFKLKDSGATWTFGDDIVIKAKG